MLEAYSYESLSEYLTRQREYRMSMGEPKDSGVRMVGLLFARPDSPLTAKEILPSLGYFHHRSGSHIDFFCVGYGAHWHDEWREDKELPYDLRRVVLDPARGTAEDDMFYAPDRDDQGRYWKFSDITFNDFRAAVQSITTWQYSGGPELLLLNAFWNLESCSVGLDFSAAVACDLDKMKADGAIISVERFFEDVFKYAEATDSRDPTWGFSDHRGKRAATSALKRFVFSLLPKNLGDDAQRALHFAVRDVTVST